MKNVKLIKKFIFFRKQIGLSQWDKNKEIDVPDFHTLIPELEKKYASFKINAWYVFLKKIEFNFLFFMGYYGISNTHMKRLIENIFFFKSQVKDRKIAGRVLGKAERLLVNNIRKGEKAKNYYFGFIILILITIFISQAESLTLILYLMLVPALTFAIRWAFYSLQESEAYESYLEAIKDYRNYNYIIDSVEINKLLPGQYEYQKTVNKSLNLFFKNDNDFRINTARLLGLLYNYNIIQSKKLKNIINFILNYLLAEYKESTIRNYLSKQTPYHINKRVKILNKMILPLNSKSNDKKILKKEYLEVEAKDFANSIIEKLKKNHIYVTEKFKYDYGIAFLVNIFQIFYMSQRVVKGYKYYHHYKLREREQINIIVGDIKKEIEKR